MWATRPLLWDEMHGPSRRAELHGAPQGDISGRGCWGAVFGMRGVRWRSLLAIQVFDGVEDALHGGDVVAAGFVADKFDTIGIANAIANDAPECD